MRSDGSSGGPFNGIDGLISECLLHDSNEPGDRSLRQRFVGETVAAISLAGLKIS
jgi:hypothetical protein